MISDADDNADDIYSIISIVNAVRGTVKTTYRSDLQRDLTICLHACQARGDAHLAKPWIRAYHVKKVHCVWLKSY